MERKCNFTANISRATQRHWVDGRAQRPNLSRGGGRKSPLNPEQTPKVNPAHQLRSGQASPTPAPTDFSWSWTSKQARCSVHTAARGISYATRTYQNASPSLKSLISSSSFFCLAQESRHERGFDRFLFVFVFIVPLCKVSTDPTISIATQQRKKARQRFPRKRRANRICLHS